MGPAKGNWSNNSWGKVAAETLKERSANEKGPVDKKVADWLLLMVRSWRGVVSLMFRLFFVFFCFSSLMNWGT